MALRVKDVIKEFNNCVIVDFKGKDIKFITEKGVVVTNDPQILQGVYLKFVEEVKRDDD